MDEITKYMNENQKRAYEWALKTPYHSVAADNARTLAHFIRDYLKGLNDISLVCESHGNELKHEMNSMCNISVGPCHKCITNAYDDGAVNG